MDKEILQSIIYGGLLCWGLFAIYYIIKLRSKNNTKEYNPYLYNSIPSVFTTIGVLGTFGGIYIGLIDFNVNDIDNSIPTLLDGMKLAFLTSILGIILSLIFRVIGQLVLRTVEQNEPTKLTDELTIFNEFLKVMKSTQLEQNKGFDSLKAALTGDTETSLSTQFIKLRNQSSDSLREQEKHNVLLKELQHALNGNEEVSLLTQLEKLRNQLTDNYKEQRTILLSNNDLLVGNKNDIIHQLNKINADQNVNGKIIQNKFDEFGNILKKNNTEALVEVMKNATETFNAQMTELIEKLVQENFKELNTSVQSLNTWQHENKEMISTLTDQFRSVSQDFGIASSSIKEITENTTKLTEDNGHLFKLIQELQKVLIDDTKFQEIILKLESTINTVKSNTETFDDATKKLNDWINKEHSFKQTLEILMIRLKEIENIKDINGEFWENTKTQMEGGVGIISNASAELRNNLDNISEEFTKQLNLTLTSLDELIQRLMVQAVR